MKPCLCRTTRLLAPRAFVLAIALAAPISIFAQDGAAPKPAVDLKPGTAHYNMRLEAGGRAVLMDVTRVTTAQKGMWLVTETTTVGGHTQTDVTTVEKKTLITRKRAFQDGTAVADLRFDGQKATGMISAGAEHQVVNADLGGVIFADGGGGEDVLAALPLAKGYSAEFLNFNFLTQQVKSLQLRVMDEETVTVPAGTFDTWKALITSLDGGSDTYALWVEKRTHRLVKFAMSIPNLNDAMATAELTK
jgi:hypothetical protein